MRKEVQKSTEGTQQSAQGIVKDPADPGLDRIARRTAKDSVFCDLFRDKRYLLQLYQALHPEDTEAAAKAAAEAEEKAAAKAAAEKERLIEAAAEKERRSARKLYLKGISVKDIAEASEVPESVVEQWLGLKK